MKELLSRITWTPANVLACAAFSVFVLLFLPGAILSTATSPIHFNDRGDFYSGAAAIPLHIWLIKLFIFWIPTLLLAGLLAFTFLRARDTRSRFRLIAVALAPAMVVFAFFGGYGPLPNTGRIIKGIAPELMNFPRLASGFRQALGGAVHSGEWWDEHITLPSVMMTVMWWTLLWLGALAGEIIAAARRSRRSIGDKAA